MDARWYTVSKLGYDKRVIMIMSRSILRLVKASCKTCERFALLCSYVFAAAKLERVCRQSEFGQSFWEVKPDAGT